MMNDLVVPIAEYDKRKQKQPCFKTMSTPSLMAIDYPPIRWIVPGYVAEGLAILAGRQKLGKTWLALDWAIAVSCGGLGMGSIECEQGDVLYIDLENGPRRIQARIRALFPDERQMPSLQRLGWAYSASRLDDAFFEALDNWSRSVENPRLVIIDVF